ncbi:transporter substrate-binding protein, partial [Nocardia pseudovaccinii]
MPESRDIRRSRSRRVSKALVAPTAVALAGLLLTGCGAKDDASSSGSNASSCVDTSKDSIKIGSLHSLSGTMAISEVTVANSTKLAVDQINAAGGVLGKKL